ncbi:hypothetical protein QBC39DRAFT_378638 [Podospora conica]|nr:hypothetical protein QBC39DRAFT_378638 [Schizothecium conicum]
MAPTNPPPPPTPAPAPAPAPPQDPTATPPAAQHQKFYGTPAPFHYFAVAGAILAPIGAALPSRGARTLGSRVQNYILYAGCFWSLNQLAFDYTGTSMVQRTNERVDRALAWMGGALKGGEALPTERAREVKAMLGRERERRLRAEGEKVVEERRGFWKRLWMGEEREGWQERRLAEERKALESGKGYSDLIWEAFEEAWGTKKTGGKKGDGEEGGGEGKK